MDAQNEKRRGDREDAVAEGLDCFSHPPEAACTHLPAWRYS